MEIETPSRDESSLPILVAGPVTIDHVARWRNVFRVNRSVLHLDLSESGPWDVAGLQLILSAMKSPQGLILERVPAMFSDVARSAGTLEILSRVIES